MSITIENELKYVLDPAALTDRPNSRWALSVIEQLYFAEGGRLRRINQRGIHSAIHTIKYLIETEVGPVNLEIENELDPEQEALLLNARCTDRLIKHRYSATIDGCHWSLDFFRHPETSEIYFCLAEVEMPRDMERPASIPAFIARNTLMPVDRQDAWKYSSKVLASPAKAARILEEARQTRQSIVTIHVQGTATRSDDEDVAGIYKVAVSADLGKEDWAGAALDAFHHTVPVSVLEDFTFTVRDQRGVVLEESDDHRNGDLLAYGKVMGRLYV